MRQGSPAILRERAAAPASSSSGQLASSPSRHASSSGSGSSPLPLASRAFWERAVAGFRVRCRQREFAVARAVVMPTQVSVEALSRKRIRGHAFAAFFFRAMVAGQLEETVAWKNSGAGGRLYCPRNTSTSNVWWMNTQVRVGRSVEASQSEQRTR